MYATGVNIHETYVGNFITKIEFIANDGTTYTVWQGTDNTVCNGWLNATFTATAKAGKTIRLTTNGAAGNWEEIDAVGLTGNPV